MGLMVRRPVCLVITRSVVTVVTLGRVFGIVVLVGLG